MNDFKRIREIASILSRYGFGDLAGRLGPLSACRTAARRIFRREAEPPLSEAVRARMVITELGPTFIKLGQMLATRPDLLPADFIHEFKKFHDDVPAFPFDQVQEVFLAETGLACDDVFETLDPVPLAAASIGQVHAGTLKSGRRVVLKVRRPGIESQVEADLRILRRLAVVLDKRSRYFGQLNALAVVDEFRRSLLTELDFANEVSNMVRYAELFRNDPTLFVPAPIAEYCTGRVIVMDFVDGIKVTDIGALKAAGIDMNSVVENGMRIILRSIFEFGFFHCDPHPGNFFVMRDGVVALLDYGTVASVDSRRIDEMVGFMLAVAGGDVDAMINVLVDMDVITDETDVRLLRADLSALLGHWQGASLKDVRIDAFMNQVVAAARRHAVRIPADLLMVGKAIAIIEGIGCEVSPDFKPVEFIQPYLQQVYVDRMLDAGKQTRSLARVGMDAIGLLKEAPYDLRRILGRMRRGEHSIIVRNASDDRTARERHVLVNRALFAFMFTVFFFGSVVLLDSQAPVRRGFGTAAAVMAGLSFVLMLFSMLIHTGRKK